MSWFWKFRGCGSKIRPPTPFSILSFKWTWQTQFLSHTPVTLKSYVFFIDVQMILVSFFKIPNHKSVNQELFWNYESMFIFLYIMNSVLSASAPECITHLLSRSFDKIWSSLYLSKDTRRHCCNLQMYLLTYIYCLIWAGTRE